MSDHISSARRGDDQLLAIMDQTAAWTVNGHAPGAYWAPRTGFETPFEACLITKRAASTFSPSVGSPETRLSCSVSRWSVSLLLSG